MARIFNIYFNYNGQSHSGMVSVRKTPFFMEYTLLNLEEPLMNELPGNKIISRSPNAFNFQHETNLCSKELMDSIIRAVAEHLHTTEA